MVVSNKVTLFNGIATRQCSTVIYFVCLIVFLDLWCDIRAHSTDVYKVKLTVKVLIYNLCDLP